MPTWAQTSCLIYVYESRTSNNICHELIDHLLQASVILNVYGLLYPSQSQEVDVIKFYVKNNKTEDRGMRLPKFAGRTAIEIGSIWLQCP